MDTATLKTKIADLAPRVAAFVSRNRAPRPLSPEERRLAVTDPQAFDAVARKLQEETQATPPGSTNWMGGNVGATGIHLSPD